MSLPVINTGDDGVGPRGSAGWLYSPMVKDHFFHPRNLQEEMPAEGEFDGHGEVGSPACGDVMRIWIKVGRKADGVEHLTECKWQTFGCASAIAATSMMSEIVLENGGMTLEEAMEITPQIITERLGGLPKRKIHCSVLGDQALKKAIENYHER
jgi:NifU-like protein involved in Fe-S cluster formation